MGVLVIDTASPSAEHDENFLAQRKGQSELKFEQIFNNFRNLKRLWTVRDFCGQAAPLPTVLKIFPFDSILRLAGANLRRQRRFTATTVPNFAPVESRIALTLSSPILNVHETRDLSAAEPGSPERLKLGRERAVRSWFHLREYKHPRAHTSVRDVTLA